jgi:hypothetical protein
MEEKVDNFELDIDKQITAQSQKVYIQTEPRSALLHPSIFSVLRKSNCRSIICEFNGIPSNSLYYVHSVENHSSATGLVGSKFPGRT